MHQVSQSALVHLLPMDQVNQVVQFYLLDHVHLVHHAVHVQILVQVDQVVLVDLLEKNSM